MKSINIMQILRSILLISVAANFGCENQTKGNYSSLATPQSSTSSQWTTTGSDIYYDAGNVGIGTTTPGSKLDVNGGIAAIDVNKVSVSGGTTNAQSEYWDDTGSPMYVGMGGSNSGTWQGLGFIRTIGSNPLVLATNNSERLRITPTGNVGIGTTAPADRLHIYSTANTAGIGLTIDNQGASVSQQSMLNLLTLGDGAKSIGDAATKGWSIFARGSAYSTAAERNDLGIGYWDGSTWISPLWLDSATSKVGIGTTTPQDKLHISETSTYTGIRITNTGTNGRSYGLYSTGNGNGVGEGKFGIYDVTANAYRMAITSAGYAGFGTYNPLTSFHLVSDDTAWGGAVVENTSSAANSTFTTLNNARRTSAIGAGVGTSFIMYDSGDTLYNEYGYFGAIIEDNTPGAVSGAIAFYPRKNNVRTEALRLTSAGNVGIGNTAPSRLLHVGSALVGSTVPVANFQNVDGTCTITPAAAGSGIACSSDERLKENFQDVSGELALQNILKLQAVTYNFKTASPQNRRTGYKAQNIQEVAPEFVTKDDKGFLQVYYDAFIPWITEAIKSLYERMQGLNHQQDAQAREIASLKAEADARTAILETENQKLKKENAEMKARLDKIEKMLKLK